MVEAMVRTSEKHVDWDPRAPAVQADQVAGYDELRRRCPVAHSEYLHWSVLRHADVVRVLDDPETFSNAASTHLNVPNGMDPPQHTAYRELIDPYFGAEALRVFEPQGRRIAQELVERLPLSGEVEWMDAFARDCALRMLCAFMGWTAALYEPLREWACRNQAATLAQDRAAMADVAFEFDGHIRTQIALRKAAGLRGSDVTTRLLQETMHGQPLPEAEIVSIVRNWTVGELATMAACIGTLTEYLASHPALQQSLREQPAQLPAAIEEILRIHAPLIANRRVVRCPVEIGGRQFEPGDRLSIMWASANRDEAVFGDPDEFRPDRDPSLNLLYGAGIHVCPGAPLARLQLRIVMETLLAQMRSIARVPGKAPVKAHYPTGGFSSLPLRIERA
jgi:cytochrome P450